MAAVHVLLCSLIALSLIDSSLSLSEQEALLKLKASLGHNGALDSWDSGTSPCKGWDGVVCFNGIITGLHLSSMGLSGKIDVDALLNVRGLRTISLANNSFSGPMPEFNRLGAMKSLLLSKNQFSGEIPDDFFSHLLSIKKVWLADNDFSGKIPSSMSQLSNLMELHLEGNQFSGSIPPIKPEKLTSLDLSGNKLTGEIPAGFSKFSSHAFAENSGLCGKPLTNPCSEKPTAAAESEGTPPAKSEEKGGAGAKTIALVVVGLLVVGLIVIILFTTRRREDDFTVLGKEKVHETVEANLPPPKPSRPREGPKEGTESASKRGSRRGSQSGKSTADIVVVNDEKGVFGLSDLMKASAEVLGNGALGSAYKAVMANGLSVVVKRMREMNALGKEGFDAKMRQLGKLRHQNILTPLAYHYRREEKLLVSEYVPKGSLLYVLHGDRGICHAELNWPTRFKIITGIARGLGFLHKEFPTYELPHGNLKSSNVLLGENYEPLLSDYALYPLSNSPQSAQAMFAFKAPESSLGVSPKCDVYCLGVLILEIITGKFPSQYLSNSKGGTDVVQWALSAVSEKREEEIIDPAIANATDSKSQMVKLLHIGAACTENDPEKRLGLPEAVKSIEELQV